MAYSVGVERRAQKQMLGFPQRCKTVWRRPYRLSLKSLVRRVAAD